MRSILQANDGSYVVIGNSLSNISGDKTENNSGLQDIWAIKFNYCNQSILAKANSPQTFCLEQNASINDIVVTGQNIKWYDAEKAGIILSKTTTLKDNTTYYASQNSNGCESERVAVLIKIQSTGTPTGEGNQTFCSNQNTTLSNVTITGTAIKWYDAATNGNQLSNYTLVRNGITYYATQTIANCESDRTAITIEIQESESIDCFNSIDELPFPKFFTPNNDGYNDYWTINSAYLKPNSGISIFDRYGKLITTLNQNESWNGTYNGQLLPSTDYWFVVTRADGKEYKGHFTMKR
jgi:gliding motility-associated-like protein